MEATMQGSGIILSSVMDRSISFVICPNDHVAATLSRQHSFFSSSPDHVLHVPGTETLPYDVDSPHAEVVSRRARAIYDLGHAQAGSVVFVSAQTLIKRLSSWKHWNDIIEFSVGSLIDLDGVQERLASMGYKREEIELAAPGEFIVKNNVLDIYASGSRSPARIRVDEFGKISSIQKIDLSTQLSGRSIESLSVHTASEVPVNAESISNFKRSYMGAFERGYQDEVFRKITQHGDLPGGYEFFLPFFCDTSTLIDIALNNNELVTIILLPGCRGRIKDAWDQAQQRYADIKTDSTRRALPPSLLWEDPENIFSNDHVDLVPYEDLHSGTTKISDHGLQRQPTVQKTIDNLEPLLSQATKSLITISSVDRIEQIEVVFGILGIEPEVVSSWSEFLRSNHRHCIAIASISQGFWVNEPELLVVTEQEIFGQAIFIKNEDLNEKTQTFEQIQDLQNLKVGDLVVHVEYGVGKFLGLEKMVLNGRRQEFLTIAYAEDAKAYVNMDELHLVSRYGGLISDSIKIDEMGSARWRSNLEYAVKQIRETAIELLNLEKERSARRGISMKKPGALYHKFIKDFPFQETKDQKSAIGDVISDLMKSQPMDRTVVGDVGFGKTEVALRASLMAYENGHQSAVMVPTTLLAQQHYQTFVARMEKYGIKVALLTRFDKDEEKIVLKGLEQGVIDIVVGTHRVVQDDVKFASLGVLIVDEEHRFGVEQKDKLVKMRKNLNTLSLTATPIPRTLGMSLQGVRDLSVISTAPSKRLSIRTFVTDISDDQISEAIERELSRDGQVFYLHNNTDELEARVDKIKKTSPKARVMCAHGQMPESELTQIMKDFYEHKFDILVCTTIIEIGIDIPNANTILIEKANNFGLAQLHQLRGRVGRSHHQGYAYLMVEQKSISDSAHQRLQAMQKASRLGDGFLIANHDLEIRGAGEILGEEQSGHIRNIGFALYMRLLNNSLDMLKMGVKPLGVTDFTSKLDLEIGLSGLISEDYIKSQRMRLSLYKRFSSIDSDKDMVKIKDEMEDRFGPVPEGTEHLLVLSQVRCKLRKLGVKKVLADSTGLLMEVRENPMLRLDKMIDMINQNEQFFTLMSPTKFRIHTNLSTIRDRIDIIFEVLDEFRAA